MPCLPSVPSAITRDSALERTSRSHDPSSPQPTLAQCAKVAQTRRERCLRNSLAFMRTAVIHNDIVIYTCYATQIDIAWLIKQGTLEAPNAAPKIAALARSVRVYKRARHANYEPQSLTFLRQSFVAEGPPLMRVIVPGTEESSTSYAA
jgi:hypothetical protein